MSKPCQTSLVRPTILGPLRSKYVLQPIEGKRFDYIIIGTFKREDDVLINLVNSMSRRVDAVINSKGNPTVY